VIGGEGVALGYLGKAGLSAERFMPNKFAADSAQTPASSRLYRTGDLVKYRDNGTLHYLGRLDNQVKVNGFRIELGDIEATLSAHPAVQHAIATVRQDKRQDRDAQPRIVAYVVIDSEQAAQDKSTTADTLASLHNFASQQLSHFMQPDAFVPLSELPLTPNRKVDRKALLAPEMAPEIVLASLPGFEPDNTDPALVANIAAPDTPTEIALATIWQALLTGESSVNTEQEPKQPTFSRHQNFFKLGGNSLLVTQLAARIRQQFNASIALKSLFENGSLQQQAALIDQHISSAQEAKEAKAEDLTNLPAIPRIESIERNQIIPASFAQQRLWFLHQLNHASPAFNMPMVLQLSRSNSANAQAVNPDALLASLTALVQRHEILRTHFALQDVPVSANTSTNSATNTNTDAQVVQVISKTAPNIALETPQSRDELVSIARHEREYRFDLVQNLCRIRVCQEPGTDASYMVFITLHHSISDGWSTGLLAQDLFNLYRLFADSLEEGKFAPERWHNAIFTHASLLPLHRQYADFAQWQRNWLTGDVLNCQVHYWQKQLAGLPPLLVLPTDKPRPDTQSHQGRNQRFSIPADVAQQLQTISHEQGVTLFMTLFSAFSVLLSRMAGQDDLAIGTPIANRRQQQTEQMLGLFVNTLVMRVDLSHNLSVAELLQQVRNTALNAYAHQDIPFEQLVEELNPERSTRYSPLFQVMFALQNMPNQHSELEGISVTHPDFANIHDANGSFEETHSQGARYDLSVTLWQPESSNKSASSIEGQIEYCSDLFEPATIARFTASFCHLLSQLADNINQNVKQLSLVDPNTQGLLRHWQHKQQPYPAQGVHELFEQQALEYPDRIALINPVQADQKGVQSANLRASSKANPCEYISYGALNRRANQLAARLQQMSIKPEQNIGLFLPRGADFITAVLAVLKAGAVYVPVDLNYGATRQQHIIDDAQLSLILTHGNLREALSSITPKETALLALDDWQTDTSNAQELNAEIETVTDTTTAKSASNSSDPQRAAYIIYTSGSTGHPKGVVGVQRSIVNRIHWIQRAMHITPQDVLVQKTAIGFVDHIAEIFQALCFGAPLVTLTQHTVQSPTALLGALNQHHISQLTLVPSLLNALLAAWHDITPAASAPGLRAIYSSGEALMVQDPQAFQQYLPNAQLVNVYGSSEVGADVSASHIPLPAPSSSVQDDSAIGGKQARFANPAFGRERFSQERLSDESELNIASNTQAYLCDDNGQLVPPGVEGELYIGGDGLARGYLSRPGMTAERFVPNPFSTLAGQQLYRTGDRARWLSDGRLLFTGRADHQVKIRGMRVELGEIEQVIRQHPLVIQAVVLLQRQISHTPDTSNTPDLPASQTSEHLVAYVVPGSDAKGSNSDQNLISRLQTWLSKQLPQYMQPQGWLALPALPLSPNGKTDRNALPAIEIGIGNVNSATNSEQAPQTLPETATEIALASLWHTLLNIQDVEQIGRESQFFALGGHSLLLTQLMSRIHKQFGVDLSISALFERQTLQSQAELIDQQLLAQQTHDKANKKDNQKDRHSNSVVPISQFRAHPIQEQPVSGSDTRCNQPLYAASFAQERLWFLEALSGVNAVYNIAVAVRLGSNLDVARFTESLEMLIARHESLRTRFVAQEPEGESRSSVAQVIDPPFALEPLHIVAQQNEIEQLYWQERNYPFAMGKDRLCRIRLAAVKSPEHLHLREHSKAHQKEHAQNPQQFSSYALFVTLHHSISDGWSTSVFFSELSQLYHGLLNSNQQHPAAEALPLLPALATQYKDYAAWQKQIFSGDLASKQLAYWQQKLANLPPLLPLPTDRPRLAKQSFKGGQIPVAIPAHTGQRLHEYANAQNATPFMVLLSVFNLLLARYSGQHDIAVGTPVANRLQEETEALIGFFTNTLVMRTQLNSEQAFNELLAQVRDTTIHAYANQDLPFEQLVEAINPERSTGYSPLFQVMFVLQNVPPIRESAQLNMTPLTYAQELQEDFNEKQITSRFDLMLTLGETSTNSGDSGGFSGHIEYSSDLFDRATVERFAGHFNQLLNAVLRHPERRMSEHSYLSHSEQQALLHDWNQSLEAESTAENVNLVSAFEQQAQTQPDAIALVYQDQQFSYGKLNEQANQLADVLLQQAVENEATDNSSIEPKIGVLLPREPALLISLLAVLKTGACYVPLDPAYPVSRLQYLLQDSGVTQVLCVPDTQALLANVLQNDLDTQEAQIKAINVYEVLHNNRNQVAANPACALHKETHQERTPSRQAGVPDLHLRQYWTAQRCGDYPPQRSCYVGLGGERITGK